jgi:hypothetical protein
VAIKNRLRKIILIGAIALALFGGAPVSPKEIEELLRQVHVAKVVHTIREESDQGDGPPKPG